MYNHCGICATMCARTIVYNYSINLFQVNLFPAEVTENKTLPKLSTFTVYIKAYI